MKTTFNIFLLLFVSNVVFAQARKPKPVVKDSLSSLHFIQVIEQTLENFYVEYANRSDFNKLINELENDQNIPNFSDEEICKQLKKISETSTFKLDCNEHTLNTIRFFQKNRRSFIKICLGRSNLYFDMYEEALNKYDLPKDLKHLSVIESGLRPQVKSPAGALGLWQFMYGTGKMYGLQENSYFDERMDPKKSTDAACRYLKKLFEIYNDWNLALAAYNAGPGNINKAIRRSGGKKTYWEVRPFLPRETQGYVPNFIAATYLMTFFKENNLKPVEIATHVYQLDTMCFKKGVQMESISKLISWDIEEIKKLNPIYKKTYIPESFPNQCITGPITKIGKLVSLEDSLYKMNKTNNENNVVQIIIPNINDTLNINQNTASSNQKFIYHKVRRGETLSKIANKYNVTNRQILDWNNLRSSKLPAGKLIKILQKNIIEAEKNIEAPNIIEKAQINDSDKKYEFYDTIVIINHYVKRNETIQSIANLYLVTVEDIKRWNNLSDNILNLEQKLTINTKVQLSRVSNKVEPKNEIKVEEKPKIKIKYYTVRSGDTFNKIALKHNKNLSELQKLNPRINPDRISVGQKIRVN